MRFVSLFYLCFIYNSHAKKNRAMRFGEDFYRGYSGYKLFESSTRKIYYHDLTISITENEDDGAMENCELIEVSSDKQREEVLLDLENQFKSNSKKLSFKEMIDLMDQCDKFDFKLNGKNISYVSANDSASEPKHGDLNWNILKGIFPGTKWCGPGNIAKNYFDLGSVRSLDKCCRKHDLCPAKIFGSDTRYHLKNKDSFTRSHCTCDEKFLICLHRTNSSFADYLGKIYFNLLHVPCIEEDKNGKCHFRNRNNMYY